MQSALLDDDLFTKEDEEHGRHRLLWISCIFVIAAIVIGGIILILWTCGVI